MRRQIISMVLVTALASSGHAAQDSQPQRFRAAVDLITVDVTVVDSRGRPVADLKPGDFVVKVDGTPRQVVSAELIKADSGKPAAPSRPGDALVSNNDVRRNARRIVVAVDQTLITPGMITPLLHTGARFVDRLSPFDYAAFITFPEPGARVDFTTDKTLVRKAMQTIIGQPARMRSNDLDIAVWEALTMTGPESIRDSSAIPGGPPPGPIMQRVMERECTEDLTGTACQQAIYQESLRIASDARTDANISLRALELYLKELVPLEGPKSMVIFSAGLLMEEPSQIDAIARLAAEARTSIHVIAVDHETDRILNSETAPPPSSLQDRSYELAGLETIADRTGGTLFRGMASGEGVFQELESTLSAWYLVAVARRPGDPDRQNIDVAVTRRGVSTRSNKNVVMARPDLRMDDAVLSDILSSPFAISGVPLRVTTFTHRDPASNKYRLRLAAQVGQPGEPAAEFAVGYALADERGRIVATGGSRRMLSPPASGPNQRLHYDAALSAEPGVYSLRFAVIDKDGRRGTVVHRVELPKFSNQVGTSDLIVGNLPSDGEMLRPSTEPQVTASELAAYLEVYLRDAARERVTVTLDIAEGESSPALATTTLTLRAGERDSWRVATGMVDARMTPGRYLARVTIRPEGGGEVLKTVSRPFSIVRDPATVSKSVSRPRGVAMTPELQRRTAAYVAGVVDGLANVVAQEEFALSSRRVVSDLLLVRFPGSTRDLFPYRDVATVNGKPLAGRAERLLDLFVKPTGGLRQQARSIMLGSDAYVPSMFNPMFVLGFLQSDYLSRFELTVTDAGNDWPREVKAVAFVEQGRPTLLRTGPFGDQDVQTRGTAWIEEATGRILQTELEVGRGRSAPKMVTKFRLDERLQVMVPIEMRTENPDGVATYTNFRRFEVATDSAIPAVAR